MERRARHSLVPSRECAISCSFVRGPAIHRALRIKRRPETWLDHGEDPSAMEWARRQW